MNVPEKYQIFDKPITIREKDVERLMPYLSGWVHLHSLLVKGVSESDIERLIILELMTPDSRRDIIRRLVTRLRRLQKADLITRIESLLS